VFKPLGAVPFVERQRVKLNIEESKIQDAAAWLAESGTNSWMMKKKFRVAGD
jgi:hypothetical protein